jgi:hypothetical protein
MCHFNKTDGEIGRCNKKKFRSGRLQCKGKKDFFDLATHLGGETALRLIYNPN